MNIYDILKIVGTAVVSYLLGSVSSAIIVSKFFGIKDIRKHGSGNAGATNTLRVAGKKAALFTYLGDALKAVIAVIGARLIFDGSIENIAVYTAALFVVLGHDFPVFFGFKGGKGIVTSGAAILCLDWRIGLAIHAVAFILMALTRYVSLGSVCAALSFFILTVILHFGDIYAMSVAFIMTSVAVYLHRGNIVRLIKGTERKLGQKE